MSHRLQQNTSRLSISLEIQKHIVHIDRLIADRFSITYGNTHWKTK